MRLTKYRNPSSSVLTESVVDSWRVKIVDRYLEQYPGAPELPVVIPVVIRSDDEHWVVTNESLGTGTSANGLKPDSGGWHQGA